MVKQFTRMLFSEPHEAPGEVSTLRWAASSPPCGCQTWGHGREGTCPRSNSRQWQSQDRGLGPRSSDVQPLICHHSTPDQTPATGLPPRSGQPDTDTCACSAQGSTHQVSPQELRTVHDIWGVVQASLCAILHVKIVMVTLQIQFC